LTKSQKMTDKDNRASTLGEGEVQKMTGENVGKTTKKNIRVKSAGQTKKLTADKTKTKERGGERGHVGLG